MLLTHDNLLANLRAIAAGLALAPTDVGVSWLPLYHDMGLIGSGCCASTTASRSRCCRPRPSAARPSAGCGRSTSAARRSRRRRTSPTSCRPSPAGRRDRGAGPLCWRAALNGAEPVSPATLDRFAARFGPAASGLRRCCPSTASPSARWDSASRRSGAVPASTASPASRSSATHGPCRPRTTTRPPSSSSRSDASCRSTRCGSSTARRRSSRERSVGRLVFRGPSATSGYYRNPEATAAITLPGGWLDSGDLAYRADGEIHVCGRRKDLIIKGGRNLAPQEIEQAAADVEGIRRGCVVAFGVPSPALGTEALVVVAETRVGDPAARERLAGAVIARVAEAVDVPPDEVVLVAPGTVPKTSSGKLRRSAARELFLSGKLAARPRLGLRRACGCSLPRRASRSGALSAPPARALCPLARRSRCLRCSRPGAGRARAEPPLRLRRVAPRLPRRAPAARLQARGDRPRAAAGPRPARSSPRTTASYLDVAVLLALLPFDVVFVAKREVLGNPFLRAFVRRCRAT